MPVTERWIWPVPGDSSVPEIRWIPNTAAMPIRPITRLIRAIFSSLLPREGSGVSAASVASATASPVPPSASLRVREECTDAPRSRLGARSPALTATCLSFRAVPLTESV